MMELVPIGVIRSPYRVHGDAPRQGRLSDVVSEIVVYPAYAPALSDIGKHRHLIVLYWLDRADRSALKATPPGTERELGVFSTRSPNRPNPIALCLVDLIAVDGLTLRVRGLEALDGSPLLDIKPYSPAIDAAGPGEV
ncbi:tRNA (N6-threonylcarbamoyladenosine(37)-N6)-methyltransferase TrmO [uncultured Methanofollis sp.]|uniref:tRNA (N6-threonylcarbamoyladenosine(37)-N6)-methyltransferase TrmO n=1 Tax=uncultured Methanofollis sp. TaxID=262500 RepID=UPI002631149E|nr:tRNA (N6-threonylcarbamoyladenosine(37)-N6)-methyltransferase TrmO [uncultured Methanofollis sp.]